MIAKHAPAGGYNLIFSDGDHEFDSVVNEYADMQRRGIMATNEDFVYLFDDLQFPGIAQAFEQICDDLVVRMAPTQLQCVVLQVRGWIGENSEHDLVGLLSTLNVAAMPFLQPHLLSRYH